MDRYSLHCVACEIWKWVIYTGSEKWTAFYKKCGFKFSDFRILKSCRLGHT
jgi:hypothetical protein